MNDLIIDNEFRDLIPPLTDDEYKQLEENILRDGIQDPLKVWNGTLIDGHNRYEIARRHNLEFKTVEMQFADRDDVKIWIIRNQLGRRNINKYVRSELVLQFESIIAEQAKARMLAGIKPEDPPLNSGEGSTERIFTSKHDGETAAQLATMADVSRDTITKVKKINQQATPEIKAALKSGDLSINAAYEGIKSGAVTVEEVKQAKKIPIQQNSGNNERYTPEEYIDAAREVLGTIDLDPASSELANETVQATKFYTAEDDGLAHEWHGNIWLNPPYAKDLLPKFAEKFAASNFNQAIVLVHNATETRWFLNFISKASAVVFPTGRVDCKTPGENRNTPLQGSAIIYSGDNVNKFLDVFSKFGWRARL